MPLDGSTFDEEIKVEAKPQHVALDVAAVIGSITWADVWTRAVPKHERAPEYIVPPPPKPSEILRRAYDVIEGGWCQYVMSAVEGGRLSYCMVGAISHATPRRLNSGWTDEGDRAMSYTRDAITALHPRFRVVSENEKIVAFNDQRRRTKTQVLLVMKRAIQIAEAAGD